ncbi:MAG: Glu-tRNA(Gln) amidotransferase subunit GatE, partial [Thaumarchaeota archaeon]
MGGSSSIDPKAVGLKVGIEVHQQLATKKKLFCSCPIVKSETLPFQFERRLRPTQSELGHIDPAAVFEFAKGRSNVYRWNPESSCLVEADEEPPHRMNEEAIDTTILIAQLLHSDVVDEIHVMRKIVIDGSNTSGFQRTAVIALGGELSVEGEEVGVQTVTLEEDAARILGEDANSRFFALDRLGVPLVEISLDPIMGIPEQVEKAALYLGRALRSTGRVARGLGTIRQDLNISTTGGSVVEVKGVQKLNLVAKVIGYELTRQVGLGRIAEEIKKRGIRRVRCTTKDVTEVFRSASSKVLSKSVKSGERVVCVSAEGLAGLLGYEPYPGIRLGKELAEMARANSLGGVIHSDEFAKQGVSKAEAEELEKAMETGKDSAYVLVAGEESRANGTAALV